MKRLFIFCLIIFFNSSVNSQGLDSRFALIPWPESVSEMPGDFLLNSAVTVFVVSDTLRSDVALLNQFLGDQYDIRLQVKNGKRAFDGAIFLSDQGSQDLPVGSYQLKVAPNQIEIIGTGSEGVFYGLQTLMQLIPAGRSDTYKIPCVNITDKPRFSYRGMHLDVSRHFFPVGFVRRYIDILSKYKMNYFHWHLTDDQGWRIEIKSHPELQKISAWRNGTR
ncbi:MAG: family 20 glycosylhydrolase, partial [Bacteroidota bacterium]